jgi:hypothetical protein
MKTTLLIVIVLTAMLLSGCIDQTVNTEIVASTPEVNETYIQPTLASTPEPTLTPEATPEYTIIQRVFTGDIEVRRNGGVLILEDSDIEIVNTTYTQEAWDSDFSIYDLVDGWENHGPYESIETVYQRYSNPVDGAYITQGKYVIHYSDGVMKLDLTIAKTRY